MSTKIKIFGSKFGSKNLNGLERRVNDWRCSQVNEFDTNAFAEEFVQGLEQLNRVFLKVSYMGNLTCIRWKKYLGHGKNNKRRWAGKTTYRSRAYIKALRNRKRKGCMKYAKKCQRSCV